MLIAAHRVVRDTLASAGLLFSQSHHPSRHQPHLLLMSLMNYVGKSFIPLQNEVTTMFNIVVLPNVFHTEWSSITSFQRPSTQNPYVSLRWHRN